MPTETEQLDPGNVASAALADELRRWAQRAKAPRIRSLDRFAEEEIVVPSGPYEGRRFRVNRLPWSGQFLRLAGSGRWSRICAIGPPQSGKTLVTWAIPINYHLFEHRERVVAGIPNTDMVQDKWREDLKPVIEASRFRQYLPKRGGGARGGEAKAAITFENGATIRFMTGGGRAAGRGGYTARIVAITEVDDIEQGHHGNQSDQITQLEVRSQAYGSRAVVYLESIVTVDDGRVWREWEAGTKTSPRLRCPHCAEGVRPEREHFVGWDAGNSVAEAREAGGFSCPSCGVVWSEEDRRKAAQEGWPEHEADPDATDTLAFRWSAADNLFMSQADIAAEMYRASRDPDEDRAERRLSQTVWAVPHESQAENTMPGEPATIAGRQSTTGRGVLPTGYEPLSAGVDVGRHSLHWSVLAWADEMTPHVLDYGVWPVAFDELGEDTAIETALRELMDYLSGGYAGHPIKAGIIDSGWQPSPVCRAIRAVGAPWMPAKGLGAGQRRRSRGETTSGRKIAWQGDGVRGVRLPHERLVLCEFDADRWKAFVHDRLRVAAGNPGAMTLFAAGRNEHLGFARQLLGERRELVERPGKGSEEQWIKTGKNHYLDSVAMGCVAGAGFNLQDRPGKPKRKSWWTEQKKTRDARNAAQPAG